MTENAGQIHNTGFTAEQLHAIFGTANPAELRAIAQKARAYEAAQGQNVRGAGRKPRFGQGELCQMLEQHRRGLTAAEIARRWGTSRQTVSRYLAGAGRFSAAPGVDTRIYYLNGPALCTTIDLDHRAQRVYLTNHTEKLLLRAFGANTTPSWVDFEAFLADRCFPATRAGEKLLLRELGLSFYDPERIVEVTGGRMAEDQQWLIKVKKEAERHAAH